MLNNLYVGRSGYGVETSIDNTQYEEFKAYAKEHSPLRKSVSANEIQIRNSSEIYLKTAGIKLKLSPKAKGDLLKLLGLSKQVERNFDSQLGEKFTSAVIDVLRKALASGGKRFTLVISKFGEVIRFLNPINDKKGGNYLSAEAFFNLFETTSTNNVDIDSLSFLGEDGTISINMKANFSKVFGSDMETYKPGYSFNRLTSEVILEPYMYRLYCTNGMRTRQAIETIRLATTEIEDVSEMLKKLKTFKEQGFVPELFEEYLNRAKNTNASMYEYNLVLNGLLDLDADPDKVDKILDYSETLAEFAKHNIEVEELEQKQLINLRSPKTISQLVEIASDFGSHEILTNPEKAKLIAGDLLFKKVLDIQNIMPQIF